MDETLPNPPSNLDLNQDTCYFAREFISGGGFAFGTNQLIFNFKKGPEKKGTVEWSYKESAVKQFAAELPFKKPSTIAFIPTSKRRDDTRYDPRFDMLADELGLLCPFISIEEPIEIAASREAVHYQHGPRSVADYLTTYRWIGFRNQPVDRLIVVDDVLTSGAQFKAYKATVQKHCPELDVIGVFWSITRPRPASAVSPDVRP